MKLLPLNGTKTHPLSEHALAALRKLKAGPYPAREFNPGIVNRLLREGCVELVNMPSPYKTRKGLVTYIRLITPADVARAVERRKQEARCRRRG